MAATPSIFLLSFPRADWLGSQKASLAALSLLSLKILRIAASDTVAHALSLPHLFPDVLAPLCLCRT